MQSAAHMQVTREKQLAEERAEELNAQLQEQGAPVQQQALARVRACTMAIT